jgi:hypothetical protein
VFAHPAAAHLESGGLRGRGNQRNLDSPRGVVGHSPNSSLATSGLLIHPGVEVATSQCAKGRMRQRKKESRIEMAEGLSRLGRSENV